jgi:hypothetical protein
MDTGPLHVEFQLNHNAARGNFFRSLQHQLDVIKVLQVGCQRVTQEQVQEERAFGSFQPANGAQLSHEAAQKEAQDWLLRGFLRDAIEAAGLFLDDCLMLCAVHQLATRGEATGADLNYLLHSVPKANHRLHLPDKLAKLEKDYGIATRFNHQILSLNRARACVVHRLGHVSTLDTQGADEMTVAFQGIKLFARAEQSGERQAVDRPGIVIAADSVLEMHFVEKCKTFKVGERIRLEAAELYDMIVTMSRFGLAMGEALDAKMRPVAESTPAAGAS